MSDLDPGEIVKSWIRMQLAENGSEEYEREFWSFEKLSNYCRKEPRCAWEIVVGIYESTSNDVVLSNLAAGPLEDLLVYHGSLALPWVADYCVRQPSFGEVLQMVWRNEMRDEVWNGLSKLVRKYS
jgi:hypothetical protein